MSRGTVLHPKFRMSGAVSGDTPVQTFGVAAHIQRNYQQNEDTLQGICCASTRAVAKLHAWGSRIFQSLVAPWYVLFIKHYIMAPFFVFYCRQINISIVFHTLLLVCCEFFHLFLTEPTTVAQIQNSKQYIIPDNEVSMPELFLIGFWKNFQQSIHSSKSIHDGKMPGDTQILISSHHSHSWSVKKSWYNYIWSPPITAQYVSDNQ